MFQMVASLLFQMEIEQLSLDLHRDNVVGLLEVNHESVEAPTRITPPRRFSLSSHAHGAPRDSSFIG